MEDQAVVIIESDKEEEMAKTREKKAMKSVLNEASSSQTKDETFKAHEARSSRENSEVDQGGEGYGVPGEMESQQEEEEKQDDESFERSFTLIKRGLEEAQQAESEDGKSPSICIFRFPPSLVEINKKAYLPEIVSIGPYHRGKDHLLNFEKHKWSFLGKVLSRTRDWGCDLRFFVQQTRALESRTRECYSQIDPMSSEDFVKMMLLDGCFVVELLRHLSRRKDVIDKDDPIFTRPWIIPILIRDLLKLENQLPYFVLESFFEWSTNDQDVWKGDLRMLALKLFELAYPRSFETIYKCPPREATHLLDLFHLSHCYSIYVCDIVNEEIYRPSALQCATQLRLSGIKFKSKKADCILDINFYAKYLHRDFFASQSLWSKVLMVFRRSIDFRQRHVLEVPSITINEFTITMLINCVALEQCREDTFKYFTDYVCFMSCLIKEPRDVTFLCSNGIITNFSQDDRSVAYLFNDLGSNVIFNVNDSHLSRQFRQVEAYYSSYWATMIRKYFSNPWSVISLFSAFLLIALTGIQTVMSILSYVH